MIHPKLIIMDSVYMFALLLIDYLFKLCINVKVNFMVKMYSIFNSTHLMYLWIRILVICMWIQILSKCILIGIQILLNLRNIYLADQENNTAAWESRDFNVSHVCNIHHWGHDIGLCLQINSSARQ